MGYVMGGGKLQEMGVALYTFLYNCPKFWGWGEALDETLASHNSQSINVMDTTLMCLYPTRI